MSDGSHMENTAPEWRTWTPAEMAAFMNRLPFVRWDRLVRAPLPVEEDVEGQQEVWHYVVAYGWIARGDGRSDYVQMDFAPWAPGVVGWSTSSSLYSPMIGKILYPDSPHHGCERVEDVFGDLVDYRVELRYASGDPDLTTKEA